MGGKSVSRGRAFRQGILPWRKGVDIPVDSRYAACRPRLTAAQGPRVEQQAILARTFQKSQSKAGRHAGRHLLYLTSSVPISPTGKIGR
jgi:hypothetical protein